VQLSKNISSVPRRWVIEPVEAHHSRRNH
jgi:hypothetical protein